MTRPSAVDLSQLAAPQVVETLSYEAIYAELKADFLARWAILRAADPTLPVIDALDLETDLLAAIFQAAAFQVLVVRARVNFAAQSVMVAFATGADLDHLGAGFGVTRLIVTPATADAAAVMESDTRLRRRIQLAPEAYGAAGSEGAYVFHTLTAEPGLSDVTAIQGGPGAVTVTVLDAAAATPSAATLSRVRAALSSDRVRPLTDVVTVRAPTLKPAEIEATLTLYPGPAAGPVLAEAKAKLAAFLVENRKLGRDLTRSAITAKLHVEGVQSIALTRPSADVDTGPADLVVVTAVNVVVGARDE
ncbi:baseplate J/gp47 family protein [Methylopila sp. 73B]|uniref:baseplate assembly protein n=1 Tax=Methylopila sp. 73B TaxID=1120792 RepID=UPI0003622A59|nr:baseplate J/gp47 family protein [Methylopila sp. 73B]